MAQATSLNKDDTIVPPHQRVPRKLQEDHVGSYDRTAKSVQIQAMKYGDIAILLRQSKNPKDTEANGIDKYPDVDNDKTEDKAQDQDKVGDEDGCAARDDTQKATVTKETEAVKGVRAAKSTKRTKRLR